METFEDFRARSLREPDVFWAEQAGLIEWQSPPKQVCDYSNPPFARWFVGSGPIFATKPSVTRYEVPGVNAYNYLLQKALGGGGAASLRNDSLGKTLSQVALCHPIHLPAAWLAVADPGYSGTTVD